MAENGYPYNPEEKLTIKKQPKESLFLASQSLTYSSNKPKPADLIDLMDWSDNSEPLHEGSPPLTRASDKDMDVNDDSDFDSLDDDILNEKVDLNPTMANDDELGGFDGIESDDDFDVLGNSNKKEMNPLAFVSASQDQESKYDPAKRKPTLFQENDKNDEKIITNQGPETSNMPQKVTSENTKMDIVSDTVGLDALLNEMGSSMEMPSGLSSLRHTQEDGEDARHTQESVRHAQEEEKDVTPAQEEQEEKKMELTNEQDENKGEEEQEEKKMELTNKQDQKKKGKLEKVNVKRVEEDVKKEEENQDFELDREEASPMDSTSSPMDSKLKPEPVTKETDVKPKPTAKRTRRKASTDSADALDTSKQSHSSDEGESEARRSTRSKRKIEVKESNAKDANVQPKSKESKKTESSKRKTMTKEDEPRKTRRSSRTSDPKPSESKSSTTSPESKKPSRKKMKKKSIDEYTYRIVLSACSKDVWSSIQSLNTKFDDIYILDDVDDQCTHLVLGDNRRTRKVLLAIAQGKWIVNPDWISMRSDNGNWDCESEYEIVDWLPGIKKSRESHERSEPPIFAGMKIFIGGQTKTDRKDIEEFIGLCGGEIVSSYFQSDVCISGKRLFTVVPLDDEEELPDSPILSEDWILDSISDWERKEMSDYLAAPKKKRGV